MEMEMQALTTQRYDTGAWELFEHNIFVNYGDFYLNMFQLNRQNC